MLARSQMPQANNSYHSAALAINPSSAAITAQHELALVHQHIQETASKRISTLEYLRRAHEGRVYWFNTLHFDKPDLARMPYFDARRLNRRATNYLFLGLSLPAVVDLNSHTPTEFLRALNLLLSEFDTFQQIHSETGNGPSSLSRARLPQMFRRATPGTKGRRTSSAAASDLGAYSFDSGGSGGGGGDGSLSAGMVGTGGGGAATMGGVMGGMGDMGLNAPAPPSSIMNFGPGDNDLLPGEEYSLLLTPGLPFDPDFFETFATLCDVLIDFYTRLLGLLPSPRECAGPVAELFTKADGKIRKLIVQGFVKEFEDSSRSGVKTEVANVGKVVLSGLM